MSNRRVRSDGRRLDLTAALREAVRTIPRVWRGAWGVLVLAAAVGLLPLLVPVSGVGHWAQVVVFALILLMALGALTRIGVTEELSYARMLGLGPGGLQFGKPELRLVAAFLLCAIFMALILVVLALVLLAAFGTADLDVAVIRDRSWLSHPGLLGPPWKLALLALVTGVALAVPLLLFVRLSLFAQATLGRGHAVSLNTMGIVHGSFWPLLAGIMITELPKLVLAVVGLAGLLRGDALWMVWVVMLALVQAPLTAGLFGAAYRQLEYWTPEIRA